MAFREMWAGRPGPVQLEIPAPVLYATGDSASAPIFPSERGRASLPQPSDAQLATAADLLSNAKAPVIFAGTGVDRAQANAALNKLVDLLQCPVIPSMAGRSVVLHDHPMYFNSQSPAADELRRNADVMLVVGSRVGNLDVPFDKYWGDPASAASFMSTWTPGTSASRVPSRSASSPMRAPRSKGSSSNCMAARLQVMPARTSPPQRARSHAACEARWPSAERPSASRLVSCRRSTDDLVTQECDAPMRNGRLRTTESLRLPDDGDEPSRWRIGRASGSRYVGRHASPITVRRVSCTSRFWRHEAGAQRGQPARLPDAPSSSRSDLCRRTVTDANSLPRLASHGGRHGLRRVYRALGPPLRHRSRRSPRDADSIRRVRTGTRRCGLCRDLTAEIAASVRRGRRTKDTDHGPE